MDAQFQQLVNICSRNSWAFYLHYNEAAHLFDFDISALAPSENKSWKNCSDIYDIHNKVLGWEDANRIRPTGSVTEVSNS